MFIGAAVFGLILNQCCYTIGLSLTSPINASIVTTSMPIFAMLLSALILKEPITGKKALGVMMGCSGKKALGVMMGCSGALMLILTSATHADGKVGDIRGDLLCLFAQFSFALYLSLFNPLIRRYNVFTINKYMFSWVAIHCDTCQRGSFGTYSCENVVGDKLCGMHRHLHLLYSDHDRPAHAASYRCIGL